MKKKDNKGMRLKYLSALVVGVVLSLPTQAQVYLDSTEVANILHPKAVAVTQPKVAALDTDDSGEEEEDTDSIIPAFTTDSILVGRKISQPDWMEYSEVRS